MSTPAEKIIESRKDEFLWVNLINANGLGITSRIVFLQYNVEG
jgi:hypothetical protein